MSSRRSRHKLMQALVRGSPAYALNPDFRLVDSELAELGACVRLQPLKRQRLLQVIHASRAMDTCLASVLRNNGIDPRAAPGIGKMLDSLKSLHPSTRGYLDHPTATGFKRAIADKRNLYAHRAGAFPNSTSEVDIFVSEIYACMSMVL